MAIPAIAPGDGLPDEEPVVVFTMNGDGVADSVAVVGKIVELEVGEIVVDEAVVDEAVVEEADEGSASTGKFSPGLNWIDEFCRDAIWPSSVSVAF
jgi:hypothetical protein